MPNATAQIVFYLWPVVVFFLFRRLPVAPALICSIIVGYLLLPSRVGLDFPMIPTIDKYALPSIMAAVMCFVALRTQAHEDRRKRMLAPPPPRKFRGDVVINILLVLLFSSPMLTMLTNREPVFAGPNIIKGLEFYDGLAMAGNQLFMIIPFLLARRFLASPESHILLLRTLCIAGLIYSIPALYEVRMSPQLNVNIYGFFPHSFDQHIRAGGFRPIVFLPHGLWLGMFFAMAILAAAALSRSRDRVSQPGLWRIAAFWLLPVLFLCKSVGAFVIALMLLPAAFLMKTRGQFLLASILAGIVLLYPMARGAGWVPTEGIYNIALKFSEARAESLDFRLDNEDRLLERANLKPLAGWGSWGRNKIYHPFTGRDISIADGAWVIFIGGSGWLGYVARFGLLTLPIIFLALQHSKRRFGPETSGLALVLAAGIVDLIPNATLTPLTWLIGGALIGRYAYQPSGRAKAVNPVLDEQPTKQPLLIARTRRGTTLDIPKQETQTGITIIRKPRTN